MHALCFQWNPSYVPSSACLSPSPCLLVAA
jgi:hypothetical protein